MNTAVQQAETCSPHANTSWQQADFTGCFADAAACHAEYVAGFLDEAVGFADAASRQPDNDRCQWDNHDVFTDNGLRLKKCEIQWTDSISCEADQKPAIIYCRFFIGIS